MMPQSLYKSRHNILLIEQGVLVYWLVGSLIITAMMGVLAAADTVAIPTSMFLSDMVSVSSLALWLIGLAIILLIVVQFTTPFTTVLYSDKAFSATSIHNTKFSGFLRYVLSGLLAIALIVGSALQALVAYQEAESTRITSPARVQALVRIEGISDSVYDASTASGYRQVAVVTHLTPLTAKLTPKDLSSSTSRYIEKK